MSFNLNGVFSEMALSELAFYGFIKDAYSTNEAFRLQLCVALERILDDCCYDPSPGYIDSDTHQDPMTWDDLSYNYEPYSCDSTREDTLDGTSHWVENVSF
jgi:hypothetical protein